MSHHIGIVHSSNNNHESPGVVVETSKSGIEVTSMTMSRAEFSTTVTLQPQDVRVLAALLHAAADNVERSRGQQR
jgi:K+/H+ antiporter YhaU regulatory subunit KhtT